MESNQKQFKIPDIPTEKKENELNKSWNSFLDLNDTFLKDLEQEENNALIKARPNAMKANKRKLEDDSTSKEPKRMTNRSPENTSLTQLNSAFYSEDDLTQEDSLLDNLEPQYIRELGKALNKSFEGSVQEDDQLALSQICENDNNRVDDIFQSSQRFLDDIKLNKPVNKTVIDKSFIVSKNNLNGSEYIQLQREMHEVNVENIDDDFLESDLSQIYKSTQYRREIENIFTKCETSICEMSNNLANVESPKTKSFTQIGKSALLDLHKINWDSPIRDGSNIETNDSIGQNSTVSPKTPSLIRKKLNELHQRRIISASSVDTNEMTNKSQFTSRGPYYGLPIVVKSLIKEFKGIDNLYDWQKECLGLPAIASRTNLIYALPTSGGKTLVAEILLLRELLCYQKNVMFVLPFVSIVQEKVWSLSPFAVSLNFLVEEYAAGKGKCPPRKRRNKKSVFVCTIEKCLVLLDSLIENGRADELGLIIVDELHLLGETGRGAILEMILSKAMFLNNKIQIVGMSATIGNLPELATFLKADIYSRDFRPVELQEYIKCGSDILKINAHAPSIEDAFVYDRTVDFDYTPEMKKLDPDHITGLVMEIIPAQSCLIFCFSKKNCESVALLLCQLFGSKFLEHKKLAKIELMKAINRDTSSSLCTILRQTIPHGVAYHHSGLVMDERKHLEEAFRVGILSVICCTSTLAAGVNLPAKRVILRSPYIGRDMISLSKYKQMIGRAGRAGMGETGESILICPPRDNSRIGSLLCSPMDEAMSGMIAFENRGIRQFILSAVGLGIADTRSEIKRLVMQTLLFVQADRFDIKIIEIVDSVLKGLFRRKALQIKGDNITKAEKVKVDVLSTQGVIKNDSQDVIETEKTLKVVIKNSTQFEISKIGKAAVKAGIDLERANKLYKDLMKSQMSLVVVDYLHLLYIVTPLEKAVEITPNMVIYSSLYSKMSSFQQQTAAVLGIPESCAVRMMTGKSFRPEIEIVLQRFYVTLMLQDLWDLRTILEVSKKFQVERGFVQSLINIAATNASSIFRFCEEMDEFWALKELLGAFTKRLSYCCTNELIPLMELPSVKIGRASQLYKAGFTNLQLIAKAKPQNLVENIEFMSQRVAKQLIAAAKLLLLERVETLREEAQDVLDVLENTDNKIQL